MDFIIHSFGRYAAGLCAMTPIGPHTSSEDSDEILDLEFLDPDSTTYTNKDRLEHLQAVLNNAFKNSAVQETIYYKDGSVLAHESLCHPTDASGKRYSIANISKLAYECGLSKTFDIMTSSLGIKKAVKTGKIPITINISVESALDPEFFDEIYKRVLKRGLNPKDIIFEILEHDVELDADISHLHALKRQGYRFALDDFGKGQSHDNRLEVFGDIIDFIKIDGPYVRAYLEETYHYKSAPNKNLLYYPNDLADILEKIEKKGLGHIPIIAEFVQNMKEIEKLVPLGVTGYQSRDLKPKAFSYSLDTREPS